MPALAPLESPLDLAMGAAELVGVAVDAPVVLTSEDVGEKVCEVASLLWLAAVETLVEADEAVEGNKTKPGLVLVVILFPSDWFIAKILNF